MKRLTWHPVIPLAVLAVLCFLGYGRALGRSFVSEDFLILRQLAEGSLWQTAWNHATGPLLGVSFITFYRPVAAFLLHLEVLFWGAGPAGYLVTHLLVHVLNAVLIHRLAQRWAGGRAVPVGIALLFALYPLHPNAVVFIGSFATLFGGSFALASLLAYERHRVSGDGPALAASLAFFALALGSYEQAVIVPLLAWAHEGLAAWRRRSLRWRAVAPRVVPFAGMLVIYFLVRRAALGEAIGGYAGFRQRLFGADPLELGERMLTGLVRLARPEYGDSVGLWALAFAGAALLAGTLWSLGALGRRGAPEGPPAARLWIFGLFWIVVTQAPFAFAGVVPGNGRYLYLTAVGLGLLVAAGGRMLARGLRMSEEVTVAVVSVALSLYYFALLQHYASVHAEAGATARNIQERLVELREAGHEQVFVAGHPYFLESSGGVPIAQVFHWGLADALEPPFTEPRLVVYPLPRFSDAALLPVLERPDLGAAFRYRPDTGTFEPMAPGTRPKVERVETRVTAGALRFRPSAARHRLVLLARGNASLYPIAGSPDADGFIGVHPPERVVESMARLYGSEIYGWIEGRSEEGQLRALGRLHRLRDL